MFYFLACDTSQKRDPRHSWGNIGKDKNSGMVGRTLPVPVDSWNTKTDSLTFTFSVLDNGAEINMKAGDVCVQRGTIHGWTNKTDKPARMYFLLSGKKKRSFVLLLYPAAPPTFL